MFGLLWEEILQFLMMLIKDRHVLKGCVDCGKRCLEEDWVALGKNLQFLIRYEERIDMF